MEKQMVNKTSQSMKRKQGGFTLVELSLALVIIAIAAYILAPIAEKAIASTEADSEAKVTQSQFSDLKSKFRRGPYVGLNNAYVIAARIPDAKAVSGTTISNEWGHAQVWTAGTLTGGVTNGAKQLTNPVPPESCLSYATKMAPFLDEVLVGTTVVKAVGGSINEITAATACNVTTATVNVIMRKA